MSRLTGLPAGIPRVSIWHMLYSWSIPESVAWILRKFFEAGGFRKPAKEPTVTAEVSILTAGSIEAAPCQRAATDRQ